MSAAPRQFLQSSSDARNGVREVLHSIFAAELLSPSRCLWIVSAWLRDIPVLDNTTGSFHEIAPTLPLGEVRLSRVLAELLARRTRVVIATRPDDRLNRQVKETLSNLVSATDADGLDFQEHGSLHAKGIVGDRYSLTGSMNLTFNGIDNLTEMLVFQSDRREVDALRLIFRKEYGGIA